MAPTVEAVGGLIASPRQTYSYWLASPLEALIFLVAVFITIFTSIENGIYFSIAASAALLLFRIAKPRGKFLGRVRVRHEEPNGATLARDVYVPLNPDGVRNSTIQVDAPPAGVIVFRMEEAFRESLHFESPRLRQFLMFDSRHAVYVNSARYTDQIVDYAKEVTRNGQDYFSVPQGDRPWNDPGPNRFQKRGKRADREELKAAENAAKPSLKAVVFDFSGVSNVDTTSIQALVDTHKVLSRYAGQPVAFHFATILSPWIKRALLAGGFGRDREDQRPVEIGDVVPQHDNADEISRLPSVPAAVSEASSATPHDIKELDIERGTPPYLGSRNDSLEKVPYAASAADTVVGDGRLIYFHLDLPTAVAAAASH